MSRQNQLHRSQTEQCIFEQRITLITEGLKHLNMHLTLSYRKIRLRMSDFQVKQSQVRSKLEWENIKNLLRVAQSSTYGWGDVPPSVRAGTKHQHLNH